MSSLKLCKDCKHMERGITLWFKRVEDISNNKKSEVSKEDKKPIKQPCNPASRKFNKEFWR